MVLEKKKVQIHGIVNLTRDSFSDGGRFLAVDDAIAHALQLHREGADVIDLGPASSHPDAEFVSPKEELLRITPIVKVLAEEKIPFSVDSYHSEVQKFSAEAGAFAINDIQAFVNPEKRSWLLEHENLQLIAMHSVQREGIATRTSTLGRNLLQEILSFFQKRFAEFEAMGVARERLWLDPGMGFFLGTSAEQSVFILQNLPSLAAYHEQIYVSVSKKSFLQKLAECSLKQVGSATLTAELFAVARGAQAIRTHDAGSLFRALKVQDFLLEESTAFKVN